MSRPSHRLAAVATAAFFATAATACGGDGSHTDATTGTDRTVTVTMTDNAFAPSAVPVRVGETVAFRFVNDGELTHEAVFGSSADQEEHHASMGTAPDEEAGHHGASTDAVTVGAGQEVTVSRTFDDPGEVVIGCHQPGHWEAGMKATVEVR